MNPQPKHKTIRLKDKAYTEFRKAIALRAGFRCEICGKWSPLTIDGKFDKFLCGHVCHKKTRGSGGGDTLDNVYYGCWDCHTKEHGPRWWYR